MRQPSRGTVTPAVPETPVQPPAEEASFRALGIDLGEAVADPEKNLGDTLAALRELPVPSSIQDSSGTRIFPTPLPEIEAQIRNTAEVVPPVPPQEAKPTPPHARPTPARGGIARSAPVALPIAVATEMAEFEGAYSCTVETRRDPAKMARFVDSLGFDKLPQWIESNPQLWRLGLTVGFVVEEGSGE